MGRIVFITQSYRPDSTILGVTRDWVRALAARGDGVDVIALDGEREREDGRVRVHDLGKRAGHGRLEQTARFYAALARSLPAASAVLVHMVPRYALLAAPLVKASGRRLALWYAQGGVDGPLRAATRLVDDVLTPTRDSFPLTGPDVDRRVRVTGHGVDTRRYFPDPAQPAERGRILAAGRLSPSKRYDFMIDALSRVDTSEWRLRIASGGGYARDDEHVAALDGHIGRLGLGERVEQLGAVPYEEMPSEYRRAWLLAHTSGTGSLDKVVLEAMACETPVVSTAPSSRALLAPVCEALAPTDGDAAAFAAAVEETLGRDAAWRTEVGAALRAAVESEHSLDGWADRVAALLRG
ncbi:MAG TPA: glycosyltransferase family 4 protein [Chloroflexota bacterium]|nr:glycosyltransferase family 4 protein [Chloroflexota bacterium]